MLFLLKQQCFFVRWEQDLQRIVNQISLTNLWDWSLLVVFRMWVPTSNISNPWEPVINASSQAPPQTFCIRLWATDPGFNKPSRWLWCALRCAPCRPAHSQLPPSQRAQVPLPQGSGWYLPSQLCLFPNLLISFILATYI